MRGLGRLFGGANVEPGRDIQHLAVEVCVRAVLPAVADGQNSRGLREPSEIWRERQTV